MGQENDYLGDIKKRTILFFIFSMCHNSSDTWNPIKLQFAVYSFSNLTSAC